MTPFSSPLFDEDSHTFFAVKHNGARSDSRLSPIGAAHRYRHQGFDSTALASDAQDPKYRGRTMLKSQTNWSATANPVCLAAILNALQLARVGDASVAVEIGTFARRPSRLGGVGAA
jgi:hypothetical protein